MSLKRAELAMAEDLPKSIRDEHGLPNEGIIIIETLNPDLRQEIKALGEGGIRGYLLSLGNFKNVSV